MGRGWMAASLLICFCVLAFGGLALGAAATLDIPWSVTASGGRVIAGAYQVDSAAGQPVAGISTSGSTALCSGFWCRPAGTSQLNARVYLPVLLRSEP